MGRQVRRVPHDWQHPRDKGGNFIPLHGRSYAAELKEWDEGAAQWELGFRLEPHYDKDTRTWSGTWVPKDDYMTYSYEEWAGRRPRADHFMPDWDKRDLTHWQMYENTSEGTPISPIFATPEELARWLADHGASAFAGMTATYEAWLATITGPTGSAPDMIMTVGPEGGEIRSGVEATVKP